MACHNAKPHDDIIPTYTASAITKSMLYRVGKTNVSAMQPWI